MKTYAQVAETLSRKKGKYEKNIKSLDPAKRFSAERMSNRIDSRLEELFNAQEIGKTPEGRRYMKNGGTLKYQDGGRPKGWWENSGSKSYLGQGLTFMNDLISPDYSQLPPKTAKIHLEGDDVYGVKKFKPGGLENYIPKGYGHIFNEPTGAYSDLGIKPVQSGTIEQRQTPYQSSVQSSTSQPSGVFNQSPSNPSRAGAINQNRKPLPSSRTGQGTAPATTGRVTSTPIASEMGYSWDRPELPVPDMAKMLKDVTGKAGVSKSKKPGSVVPGETSTDWMGAIAPFMDNLGNLMNPTPNVPVPAFMRAPVIDTKVNVSPALDEMRRGVRGFNRQVDNTVSQGNTAAAYKGKALADFLNRSSGLMMDKDNQERGLRNQQAQSVASVDNMNTQIQNSYQNQLMGREESERMRRIGLIGNLGEDFMTMSNDKKMHDLDIRKHGLLMEVFKDVIGSSDLKKLEEFKKFFNQAPKAKESNKYGGKLKRRVKR